MLRIAPPEKPPPGDKWPLITTTQPIIKITGIESVATPRKIASSFLKVLIGGPLCKKFFPSSLTFGESSLSCLFRREAPSIIKTLTAAVNNTADSPKVSKAL